ncbi:MAG: VWA domain-containing protein [Desulfurococcales archaeon]|nr:VWA domain-containing protein [Desulfurococcales archaeon]
MAKTIEKLDGVVLEALSSKRRNGAAMILRVKGDKEGRNRVSAALAIDVSPSMDGDRIFYAKSGAVRAIDTLENGDGVSVIGFCKKAWLEYEATIKGEAEKREAARAVARLKTCYGTNIEGALRLGVESLSRLTASGGAGVLLLITDGEPNVGKKDPDKLAEILRDKPYKLLAVGVGLEYNEKLLARLAEKAGGEMRHISDPSHLEESLLEEVAKAARLVASKLILRIKASKAKPRIYGWKALTSNGYIVLDLGSLSSGEVIDVGLELDSGPLEVEVEYIDPSTGAKRRFGPIKIKAEAGESDEYVEHRLKVLKALDEAEKAVEKKDYRRVYEIINEVSEATLSLGDMRLYEETVDIAELLRSGEAGEAAKRLYSARFKARRGEEGGKAQA